MGVSLHDMLQTGPAHISTIGFGLMEVSSASRVPKPPANKTTFMKFLKKLNAGDY